MKGIPLIGLAALLVLAAGTAAFAKTRPIPAVAETTIHACKHPSGGWLRMRGRTAPACTSVAEKPSSSVGWMVKCIVRSTLLPVSFRSDTYLGWNVGAEPTANPGCSTARATPPIVPEPPKMLTPPSRTIVMMSSSKPSAPATGSS